MKVLLVAEEAAGLRALRLVDRFDVELLAVLTSSRPQETSTSSIGDLARRLDYDVWDPARMKDPAFGDTVRELAIDVVINVHALHIVDPAVIDAPRIGCFNLHPGPLPEMAGLNAPSWAIFLGAKSHGVTLHWMGAGIDTGAIAYAAEFELTDSDTGLSVSSKCVSLGIPLVEKLLVDAAQDPPSIPATPQDLSARRLFRKSVVPGDGWIDWSSSARQIDAHVRASNYGPFQSPWGWPKTRAGNKTFCLDKVSIVDTASCQDPGTVMSVVDDVAHIATSDAVVSIERVLVDGKPASVTGILDVGQVLARE